MDRKPSSRFLTSEKIRKSFIEFFVIFFAVSLGFFADDLRESKNRSANKDEVLRAIDLKLADDLPVWDVKVVSLNPISEQQLWEYKSAMWSVYYFSGLIAAQLQYQVRNAEQIRDLIQIELNDK